MFLARNSIQMIIFLRNDYTSYLQWETMYYWSIGKIMFALEFSNILMNAYYDEFLLSNEISNWLATSLCNSK